MHKKLDTVITELDGIHDKLNNIYAEGAIEGYTEKWLGISNSGCWNMFQLYLVKNHSCI